VTRLPATGARPIPGTIAAPELDRLVDGDRQLVVEFSELPSALMLLIEELGGRRFGAPLAWRKAVVSRLEPRDVAALVPFVNSQPQDLPGCVLPPRAREGTAALEQDLELIAATPPEVLAAQLNPDGVWGAVARNPGPWLPAFVRAARRACAGLRGSWKGAAGLLDREAERVGVAALRCTQPELIAALVPPAMWRLQGPAPHGAARAPRLGMVPLLAGRRSAHARFIDGELTHIAYPLHDAWRLFDGGARPPAALEALLGVQRALILRELDRSMTAGQIAGALRAVPSAASHHLTILERAGLVERERRGRHVVVRRTARGSEILALYERS
jgi:DNA-binding transcriptional ArsR family regulator